MSIEQEAFVNQLYYARSFVPYYFYWGVFMGRAFTKDIEKLDPDTFGGSKACHVLVQMMNENMISNYSKHRVLGFISDVNYTFKNLRYIPADGARERVMVLVRDTYYKRIDEMPYPPLFVSHLRNVVNSIFKKNFERGLEVLDLDL